MAEQLSEQESAASGFWILRAQYTASVLEYQQEENQNDYIKAYRVDTHDH